MEMQYAGTANPAAGTTPPPAAPGTGSAYPGGPAMGMNGAMPANQTMQNATGQQMPQTQAGYSMPQGNPANVAPVGRQLFWRWIYQYSGKHATTAASIPVKTNQ